MNFKYAFLNLCRKPVFTILTILQLIAACTLLYEAYSYKIYYSTRIERMLQVFKNKNLYYINTKYDIRFENIDKKNFESFNKYLKNSPDFNYIAVNQNNLYLNIGDKNGEFIQAYSPQIVGSDKYQIVYKMDVDDKFFPKFNFKVSKGRIFNKGDFNIDKDKALPAILGADYSGMYKVGDIIKDSDLDDKPQKIQVIGFLEKGYYFSTVGVDSIDTLDKYIIVPQQPIVLQSGKDPQKVQANEDKYRIELLNNSFYGYIDIKETDRNKLNQISDSIVSEARKDGFQIKIVSLNDSVQGFITSAKKQENSINVLFIIIFCFTSVGIVSSVLYSISRQLKEFGVHIMQGAVLCDIAKRVLYEILILFLTAFMSTFMIAATILREDIVAGFNLYNLSIVFGIFIILALLLSVIPVIKILKLSISDLVRGRE